MKIVHGFWRPDQTENFVQTGQFYLWVETDEKDLLDKKPNNNKKLHSHQLAAPVCLDFLKTAFNYDSELASSGTQLQSVYLPTVQGEPLPSSELIFSEAPEDVVLNSWDVVVYPVVIPLKAISDVYFLSHYQHEDSRVGRDFLFWYYFSQSLKQFIEKDQYIPVVLAENQNAKTKLHRCWKIVSPAYDRLIENAVKAMPLACSQPFDAES